MSTVLHMQQTLPGTPASVFRALIDRAALETWFAERAFVSVPAGRYDFWGRFTPETPTEKEGRHVIQAVEPNRRLRYTWRLRGADTTVDLRLAAREGQTVIGLWHYDILPVPRGKPGWYAMDDVWALWLESLRRYLDGRPLVRCDFSAIRSGDVVQTVEIDAPPAAVWDALVNPTQLNRWIASNATAKPRVGGVWMDWAGEGALEILAITPEKTLSLAWEIDGMPTVVTWTIETSGGKTRLTLSHSGFAPEYASDGELLGWLSYLSWLQSLVEYGIDWLPPLKEVARDAALYYAATIWARQEELLDEQDESWARD